MNRHRSLVQDWMTNDPTTIPPMATLLEAYQVMKENDIRRLPVVDTKNELLGIITMSDIQRMAPIARAEEASDMGMELSTKQVRTVMAESPITVAPDDTIMDAAEAMLEYQISGLPVVEGNNTLVGIITESDIFALIVESWSEMNL